MRPGTLSGEAGGFGDRCGACSGSPRLPMLVDDDDTDVGEGPDRIDVVGGADLTALDDGRQSGLSASTVKQIRQSDNIDYVKSGRGLRC